MAAKIKGNQVLIDRGSGDETTRKVSGTTGKAVITFRVKRKTNNVGRKGYAVETSTAFERKDGGTTKGKTESRWYKTKEEAEAAKNKAMQNLAKRA